MKQILFATAVAAGLISAPAMAEWHIDFGFGNAWNAKQNLIIYQGNHPDFHIQDVTLETHGGTPPLYYSLKVAKWENNSAWEIEHTHHKVYLDNSSSYDSRLYRFEITDGYNLFMLNRVKPMKWENTYYRLGVGTVIAHPDIHFDDNSDGVEDRTNFQRGDGAFPAIWKDGYRWGGYAIQAAIQKSFPINDKNRISIEGKLVNGAIYLSVDDGHVYVPNNSIHFVVSYGYTL